MFLAFGAGRRRMIGIYSKRTVEPESARQKLSERHARFPRTKTCVTFVVIAYNTRQNTHINRLHDTKTKITRNRETGEGEKEGKRTEFTTNNVPCLTNSRRDTERHGHLSPLRRQ